MNAARLRRVLASVASTTADQQGSLGAALCATSVDVLGVSGAAVTLRSGEPHSIGASNGVMSELEELEHSLGEGPCVDAFNFAVPASEPASRTQLLADGSPSTVRHCAPRLGLPSATP